MNVANVYGGRMMLIAIEIETPEGQGAEASLTA